MIQVRNAHECRGLISEANVPVEHEHMIDKFVRYSPQCWAGFVDDRFACMWGLIPPTLLSNSAYLWLVVNELVDNHKFVFVRHSQIEMKKMLNLYPVIIGHCDVRHERSMQWLKWLGARFDFSQGPAAPFTIVRNDG